MKYITPTVLLVGAFGISCFLCVILAAKMDHLGRDSTRLGNDNKLLMHQNDSLKGVISIKDSIGTQEGCAVIIVTGSDNDINNNQ